MSGFDLEGLRAAVAEQGPVVRVVITGFKGSTPRETGASMLVWPGGQSGTIGGGALEFQMVERAQTLGSASETVTLPLGPALGQCCGGSVTMLLEVWDATALAEVATDASSVARPITGSDDMPFAIKRAAQAIREGRGAPLTLADGWIIEAIRHSPTAVYIYGAGHVGRAIAATFASLPFAVTLVDDASQRFPYPMPEGVTPLLAANPTDAVATAPDDAIHLVLTYSHALDLEICHRALARPFRHLGLIGSDTKAARFRRRLAELGHSPATIARLACPIGDRSLGKEPAAIAIGVAAELIRLRNADQMVKKQIA